jgi:hypothetical protein
MKMYDEKKGKKAADANKGSTKKCSIGSGNQERNWDIQTKRKNCIS